MEKLYPLLFESLLMPKVWGGSRLHSLFGKGQANAQNIGESWELAAFEHHDSMVVNGFLAGNSLGELIEVYMGSLVGEQVYEKFGEEFPLLVKFIDASSNLSVQVHPDDHLAWESHKASGKTEMWYVVDAAKDAKIYAGFNKNTSQSEVRQAIADGNLHEHLEQGVVKPGDVFYIPSGKVHAIGAGVVLCEIQQASDITYRLYDWNRMGEDGKPRPLHKEKALKATNFDKSDEFTISYNASNNTLTPLVSDRYFTTNIIAFNSRYDADYFTLDSFVALVCIEGAFSIEYPSGVEFVKKGDVVLLPAEIKQFAFLPSEPSKILETYLQEV